MNIVLHDAYNNNMLTEVKKEYKGCLRSWYFTVIGFKSYRNQITPDERPP